MRLLDCVISEQIINSHKLLDFLRKLPNISRLYFEDAKSKKCHGAKINGKKKKKKLLQLYV